MSSRISLLLHTDFIKSLFFNLHYFPFRQAIRFPVLLSWHFAVIKKKGSVTFDCPVKTGLLKLGYCGLGTQDTRYDRTKWDVDGKIIIKGQSSIGRGTNISVGGVLEIGPGFIITGSSTVICKHRVNIGNNVLVSWDCLIMDTDFHPIFSIGKNERINSDRPIIIGDDVWIGCRSTILKGAEIPDGSVVAAQAVISKKLDRNNCIYGGSNGGEIIKEGICWFP